MMTRNCYSLFPNRHKRNIVVRIVGIELLQKKIVYELIFAINQKEDRKRYKSITNKMLFGYYPHDSHH
jgi:hypothetical protein